jgi:predicted TPR repeat methyltransferase
METFPGALPELPDVQTVSTAVSALASANPGFAAMLTEGVPTADALARLGLHFFREHQIPEATAAFRGAVALAPDNPVMWTNYGAALDCAGSFADAAACLEHSLVLSRRQPDTWLLLGLVRKKRGDLDGCEAAYRIALEQEPDSSTVWECLGLLKEERRDYAQAIECFIAGLKLGGTNAAIVANLGKLYYQVGRIPEACEAYNQAVGLDAANAHYRQMARKTDFIRDLLNGESVDDALATYEHSLEPTDDYAEKDRLALFNAAFGQLSGFGHVDAAKRVGKKHLELWPNSAVLQYLMKSMDGEPGLDRSPSGYIVEYFDSFADGFDAKLVGVLGYDAPEKICSAVREATPANHKYDAVDVGCGTGLCGPLLRPFAKQLIGVDLSPKMLEQAAKLGVYDHLMCEELTAFLSRSPGHFDLVVAADVIVYIGDLIPMFAAAATATRAGGLFAFSTELWTGESYRLQRTGRFAHAPQYVRSLAGPDFVEHVCVETTIRLEAGTRVGGNLFVFQRRL